MKLPFALGLLLLSSTVQAAVTRYLQSRDSLQAGTTFYVSSGTVSGALKAGTLTADTVTAGTLVSGQATITNAAASGTAGTASSVLTGDPNTKGLIVKGNTYTPAGAAPTNEVLWLKADAIQGLSDGDAVATWADSSGNGRDASAAGAARPTYKTNILNGKPGVLFNGTANVMTGTYAFSGSLVVQIFMVLQRVTNTQGAYFEMGTSGTDGANSELSVILGYNTAATNWTGWGPQVLGLWKNNPKAYFSPPANGTAFIAEFRMTTPNVSAAFLNNAAGSVNGTVGTNLNTARYNLGARTTVTGFDWYMNCYIFEAILYTGSLVADATRTNIVTYLTNKYGLTITGLSTAQTSNLQEWQSMDGTVLSSVSSAGKFTAPQFIFGSSVDTTTAPGAAWTLAPNAAGTLYISTGTGAGAWVPVGGQQ